MTGLPRLVRVTDDSFVAPDQFVSFHLHTDVSDCEAMVTGTTCHGAVVVIDVVEFWRRPPPRDLTVWFADVVAILTAPDRNDEGTVDRRSEFEHAKDPT